MPIDELSNTLKPVGVYNEKIMLQSQKYFKIVKIFKVPTNILKFALIVYGINLIPINAVSSIV